jgi:hypothetical protein
MNELSLPQRAGAKPDTTAAMPHSQLTENSDVDIYDAFAEWLFSLEHISEGRSAVSLPSSRAAWLAESAGAVRPGLTREFTHIHTEPGLGSQHLSLDRASAAEVFEKGWGEPHPMNDIIPDFELLMIFAARDTEELEVIKQITLRALEYSLGVD